MRNLPDWFEIAQDAYLEGATVREAHSRVKAAGYNVSSNTIWLNVWPAGLRRRNAMQTESARAAAAARARIWREKRKESQ